MEGSQLITGNKYDQVVRFILILFFVITGGGVVFAISGGKIKPAVVEKQVTIQAVSEVTPEVLSESNLGNQPYLVIARTNGEYAFVKVQNAQIQNEKYVDLTELVYQNGEAKLTQEIKGTVNIYDDDNRVIENAMIVLHGVVGITLTDGTTLPVKIINGRINGGKMVGDVDLRSLKDNSQILGTIDTRGNFENISITPSLQEVDIATAAVGKEVFKWLDQAQETVTVILPGAEISPTPSVVSGAITIDPVTGLAIINSGVVGDAQIVNGSITTLKLADGAVTTIKLADSAVTGAKITDGTITSGKIGDGEITNAKLAQITEANKVSGAAVSLRGGGGLTNDSGLSLLTGCSIDQVLSWDGDSWECQSVSGVGTGVSSINSLTGGLTITGSGLNTVTASGTTINIAGVLPSVGTAGTYGTATDIPVLTTDANGRVSGVTNTAISGLTSANLAASAGITNGQLSNSSIFVSPGSGISVSGSPVSLGGTVTIAGVDASTTLKGVANYNSTNFSVVSGSVNTIQNIDSTATPTFNSLTLTKVNNQLVLGTTNTTTISSTAPSASRTATIPALSGNDTFVFLNESGTLTNKTIAAGANTISGLTNSNLSGTAGITDANLATITTANKVSGSAVQLSTGGGLVDSTGLSLLRTCASGEILKYNGTSWVCNTDSTSGSPTLNANGGLVNDSGLSLLRTCSDNQILKWTAATGWTCSADSTGGGSVTVAESDGSPSVGAVTTLQFGPATTSSEEFVITDQTGGVARIRTGTKVVLTDTAIALTNKTIDASLNTLSNIADTSLSTITTANKVSGSAVQLSTGGGLVNSTGLSLLRTCSSGEILKYSGTAWACSASGTSLDSISAALGGSTIANGDNAQAWNFALTTAVKTAFTFGETTAAINGAGSQYILNARTLPSSTAAPLGIFARSFPIIDTTAAGGVTIGNATLAQAINIDSGVGAINIGNSATGKTITIGSATGTGALNMYAGTGNFILDGAGATTYSFGTSTTNGTFTMGGTAQTGTANLFTGTGAMSLNIGTGASAKAITLGNTNTSTSVNINSGTGGITLLTGTSGNLSFTTGTTGTVTLDSGTTGAINIGTNANAKTLTLGNSTGATAVNINSGTGGITLLTGTSGNLSFTTGTTGTVTLDSGTTGAINIGTNANAKTITMGNTTGATALNLYSGTGNVNFMVGPTSSTGRVVIGNSATATPDLLVLDNGTADPIGTNGATYYNTSTNKFRCYQNGAWTNCIGGDKLFITKSVNQSVISSTTLTDDTALQFSIGAGETWVVKYDLIVTNSSNAGPDWKSAVLAPAGSTCNFQLSGSEGVGTIFPQATGTDCTTPGEINNTNVQDDAGFGFNVQLQGIVTAGVTGGTVKLQWAQSTSTAVNLTVKAGSFLEAFKVGGADLAEVYSSNDGSIAEGDVVSVDSSIQNGVQKSRKTYDSTVLGIVSTKPGMVLGDGNVSGTPVLVALSGRVPVKVSAENGEIKAGDYLTSSSIPGVAMRATKAGAIIGTAMTGYDGEGVGVVIVFVKNGNSTGSNLTEVMKGIDVANGYEVLTNLIMEKNQVATDSANMSDIIADRVVAGLEIITPKVVTQDLLVSGDATFSGILYADTIKAGRIEGVDILTRKLSLLSDRVAGVATAAGEIQSDTSSEIDILDLISKKIAEVFRNTVEFLGKVIFRGEVNFVGRPTFNKDTAGFATIKTGGSQVEILFEREYKDEPVVTATVQIVGGASVADIPGYAIADVNTRGFKIRLSRGVGMDLRFAWVALAVNETGKFEGSGGVVDLPSETVTPEPTPILETTITPTPTTELSSTPSPTETPTPTPVVVITPTETASESGNL